MKKKILSIALALCMVLTMMPMATGVAWATESTGVMVGGVQMVNESNTTTYYKNSAGLTGTEDDYNAKYEPGVDEQPGTLTLKGLSLSDSDKYCIYANKALNIVLEGGEENANSLVHSGTKNIIYVEGNLTISGPGSLTAVNGNGVLTTIYATGNITINGGAVINATHAGGRAQAINADATQGANYINISGTGTTVTAENSGKSSNDFAVLAKNIHIFDGATLTATSGKKAVSGTVNGSSDKIIILGGDSKSAAGSLTLEALNTNVYKYVYIVDNTGYSTVDVPSAGANPTYDGTKKQAS